MTQHIEPDYCPTCKYTASNAYDQGFSDAVVKWGPHSASAKSALEAAKQEGRREGCREGLEEAAKLVQNYDTHGDHTQGWQDIFAERIRQRKDES